MRERFRYPGEGGVDLVINELPGPKGSVWVLMEDAPAQRQQVILLSEAPESSDIVSECVQRLMECHGGRSETWTAVIYEEIEPTF